MLPDHNSVKIKRIGLLIISFFSISVLGACAKPAQIVKEPSIPIKPGWIENIPKDKDYYYFVGIASAAESLEQGQNLALKDAVGKVAGFLGTKVDADFEMEETQLKLRVKDKVKTESIAYVSKAYLADLYYIKTTRIDKNWRQQRFDVFVLISFPKGEAELERKRREAQVKEHVKAAYELYKKGKKSETLEDYFFARRLYNEATHILQKLESSIAIENSEIHNSMELLALLQARANSITKQLRKVHVWVEETNLGSPNTPSILATHLMSGLGKNEFTLIDLDKELSFNDSFRGRETALVPLKNVGVRYLIIGEVKTEYSSEYLNNFFYCAQGAIRIIDVTNGEIITDIPIKSKGYHRSKKQAGLNALANAGRDVSKSVIDAILAIESR